MAPRVRRKPEVKRTMFRDETISTAVRMTCDGASMQEIADRVGHPPGKVRNLINEVRFEMMLPRLRKDFVEYRHEVLSNLDKWEETNRQIKTMKVVMRGSMCNLSDLPS
jgi:hypothetical protein